MRLVKGGGGRGVVVKKLHAYFPEKINSYLILSYLRGRLGVSNLLLLFPHLLVNFLSWGNTQLGLVSG